MSIISKNCEIIDVVECLEEIKLITLCGIGKEAKEKSRNTGFAIIKLEYPVILTLHKILGVPA